VDTAGSKASQVQAGPAPEKGPKPALPQPKKEKTGKTPRKPSQKPGGVRPEELIPFDQDEKGSFKDF